MAILFLQPKYPSDEFNFPQLLCQMYKMNESDSWVSNKHGLLQYTSTIKRPPPSYRICLSVPVLFEVFQRNKTDNLQQAHP
jgi:hypothetical protein